MEDSTASIKAELTGGALTRTEREEWASSLVEMWDGALDDLWGCLEQRLAPAELEPLAAEQAEWRAWKEAQAALAGTEPQAGLSLAETQAAAAAELTRDRVYALLEGLEGT